ncbi:MAG: hypothetical protein U0795_07835 [Pirellulales bacterium]
MNACKFGMALLAIVALTHSASAQVRPLGRVPATGQVMPASHCASCAGGGGYVGQSYFEPGYGGYGCGQPACGGCGHCGACCGPITKVAVGAVGLAGELLCDVKHVVGSSVCGVVHCLLPCGHYYGAGPGCSSCSMGCGMSGGGCGSCVDDCGGGCDSGCDTCSTCGGGGGYDMVPSAAPAPTSTPTPATAPAGNPFQDDPISSAQSAVRREAAQRAALAQSRLRSANGVNQAAYRRPVAPADAQRYRPQHASHLRREAGSARTIPQQNSGYYR